MQEQWVLDHEEQRRSMWYLSWESFFQYSKMWIFVLKNELKQQPHIYKEICQSDVVLRKGAQKTRNLRWWVRWTTSAFTPAHAQKFAPAHVVQRTSSARPAATFWGSCAGDWRLTTSATTSGTLLEKLRWWSALDDQRRDQRTPHTRKTSASVQMSNQTLKSTMINMQTKVSVCNLNLFK